MRYAVGACLLMFASTSAHAAGGAYVVDDAAIGSPGECQVESWTSFADNGDFIGTTQPACVLKFGSMPVEITTVFAGVRDDAWAAVTGLQAKTILVPVGPGTIGVALSVGTLFDVTRSESAAYVNVPVSIKLHDRLTVHLNGGALWAEDTHFTWGAAFEWEIKQPWTFMAEIFGLTGEASDPRVQVGLRYTPIKSIDVDVIYGHSIAGENAHWITTGLTARF